MISNRSGCFFMKHGMQFPAARGESNTMIGSTLTIYAMFGTTKIDLDGWAPFQVIFSLYQL